MRKRFLGIICLLYSGIILYVWIFDKLKNFLAPNMQIYLKLSFIPLLLIGLIFCFNDKINYKFKMTDLVLFLPLILLILSRDGRLTTTFANNRNSTIKTEKKIKKEDKKVKKEEKQEEIEELKEENQKEENYDFSNVDYDVTDEVYDTLATYISTSNNYEFYEGKTIRVRGFTLKNAEYLPSNYFVIGKYSISCCAADAGYIGFYAKYDLDKVKDNTWYEIEGVLEKGKDKEGDSLIIVKVVNIKEIDSKKEEQYIYPCYYYDNKCSQLDKYNLKY